MKCLVVLNGSNLRRWRGDLPERLRAVAADRRVVARVVVSRSPDHANRLIGQAIEAGCDAVLSCGGDGTLHHVVNHPLIARAAVGMLPAGTINAFLRAAGADVRDPAATFRQLLAGRIVDGHVGLLAGRRFACFASWGFDARVVHRTPSALKRRLRAGSYAVTGLRELARGRSASAPGRAQFHVGDETLVLAAGSVIVSKIANYAGFRAFDCSAESADLEGLVASTDRAGTLAALYGSIAVRGLGRRPGTFAGVRFVGPFTRVAWCSGAPTHVQLDGEAVAVADARRFAVRVDPVSQRYLLPAGE
ncbi:MAG: hypothetical protein KF858_06550 [Candidatus Sumerlaeia bacterium]|nr:hypothetical protein [Candidatus Sumerlaeia bacterium]